MACVNCGSAPCRCASNCECATPLTQDPGLCCHGNRLGSSCCQNTIVAAPQPFYNCAPACPQDHTQRIVLQQFYSTISISDSWNVPGCDGSTVVNVVGLKAALPGSYIWNSQYGFFQITAFNASTGQLTLLNTCITGNASAGTQVPACTEFIITDPPCDCSTESGVCVAIDFTAPEVGVPTDITLTSTTGLQIGFTVQIGTGQYRIVAVKPNNVVTIVNDGDGLVPGTSVIAKNSQGQFQYCLQIISSNPCDTNAVQEVVVLGCSNETIKPLTAGAFSGISTYEGELIQAVSLIGIDESTAAYRPLDTSSRKCVTLSQDLIITAGVDTYVVNIVSLNGITTSDIAADIEDYPIAALIQATTPTSITIKFNILPPSNDTIPAGSWMCIKTCCEFSIEKLRTFQNSLLGGGFNAGPQDVNTGAPLLDSGVFSFDVSNVSQIFTAVVMVNINILFSGTVTTGHTQKCNVNLVELYGEGVPPVGDVGILKQYYMIDDGGTSVSEFISRQMFTLLTPGQTKTINVQAKVEWSDGNANFADARISASVSTLQLLF